MKRRKINVDIGNDSWKIFVVQRNSCERDPVEMMASAHERFPFVDRSTWNLLDFRPRWFLD